MAFEAPITTNDDGVRRGPVRQPRQMLGDQEYDGHSSVDDDAVADDLGLSGAPIEGPTHLSQFDPLAKSLHRERRPRRDRAAALGRVQGVVCLLSGRPPLIGIR